jgi:uncharacterized protein (TIGR00369 family)
VAADQRPVLPTDRVTFDSTYGLEVVEQSPALMRGRVAVTDRVRQPFGLVHGGVFCAIGEALASIGTSLGVTEQGDVAVGMSNHTTFLRPILEGTIHAEAKPRHRGRSSWLWDVEITDDDGTVCALGRLTIAVRPRRP